VNGTFPTVSGESAKTLSYHRTFSRSSWDVRALLSALLNESPSKTKHQLGSVADVSDRQTERHNDFRALCNPASAIITRGFKVLDLTPPATYPSPSTGQIGRASELTDALSTSVHRLQRDGR
jgi:hypothetical protein